MVKTSLDDALETILDHAPKESVEPKEKRRKKTEVDFLCKGHILNSLSNKQKIPLFIELKENKKHKHTHCDAVVGLELTHSHTIGLAT